MIKKSLVKLLKFFICVLMMGAFPNSVLWAQSLEKKSRKVQEVNFEEMMLKGTVRNPEGAFLVQKRGIKFVPLVDIQKNMDNRIRESVEYIR